MVPVFDMPLHIFEARFYISWNKGIISFIVHLPFRRSDALDLFRFVRLPLPITIETVCHENTEEKYIAVDEKHASHFTMNYQEWQECMHVCSLYICPAAQLVSQHLKSLCLGSIFAGDIMSAQTCCGLTVAKFNQVQAVRVPDCIVQFAIPHPGALAIEKM